MIEELKDAEYDPELGFAYDPNTGRLWKIQEVDTTIERAEDSRVVSRKLRCLSGINKVVTHIMHKIMTGEWPSLGMIIDHEDGDVYNMTWINLREATHQQNAANRESIGRFVNADVHMEIGVYYHKQAYMVSIGKTYYGQYSTVDEANAIALTKRKELYGDFVRREI